MIVRTLGKLEVMQNAHNVDARSLYDHETAVITALTLQPGQSLKRHITPVDVAFYVVSGKGVVAIGDESCAVEADTLVESPKGIVHAWYNEGTVPLRILVIKAPRPTNATVFVGS
ncbi:MAG: cupin domain-containing protein [Candidatus Bipolaricaulota bacterium]